jgi:hypothetical protein
MLKAKGEYNRQYFPAFSEQWRAIFYRESGEIRFSPGIHSMLIDTLPPTGFSEYHEN